MTIGDMIFNRRKELGLTLEDVGKAVGVTKGTVLRWESGSIHNMKRDKIAALSKVLSLDPTLFITPSEVLTEEEQRLLAAYRTADRVSRDNALMILESSAAKADYGKKDHSPAASDVG